MKSKFVFMLIIVAGFAATGARAQSDRILDLMGLWSVSAGNLCKDIYQLSATSGNVITIRFVRGVCTGGGVVPGRLEEFRLKVNGRSLTGTNVLEGPHLPRCRMPKGTERVTGRIAPDWNGLVIVFKRGQRTFNLFKCAWDTRQQDSVMQFSRHR